MIVIGGPGRPRTGLVRRVVRRIACAGLVGALTIGTPATSTAAPAAFEVDLGVRADFVAQTNFVQCVGASMQMMLNMLEPQTDRSARTQLRLQALAREWSGPSRDGFERQGASVRGWAAGLTILGAGPYEVVGKATLDEAVLAAARAIRATGKPVGLLMWRGRHAWVMSGFRATADPLHDSTARITAVHVEDPLYPYGSKVWGPSPAPGGALSLAQLRKQFVPRRASARWGSQFGGMYVLVVPYQPGLVMYPVGIR